MRLDARHLFPKPVTAREFLLVSVPAPAPADFPRVAIGDALG
ncbi:hypothetical protein [Nannocystis sp. SCPEA4]|nr:hypothetical protein [Nannocystis sp. SCPEA4]MCY1062145.1 hypothetical protein [Nannocystis sp. SCPEA4]